MENWSRIKIGGVDISLQQTRIQDYKLPPGYIGEIELQAVIGVKHYKWSIPILTTNGDIFPLCQTITSGAELIDILDSFPAIAYEEDDTDDDGGEDLPFPNPPASAPARCNAAPGQRPAARSTSSRRASNRAGGTDSG